ncbi:hypothetical protein GCM10011591_41790 [Nocardia camponoti]|uniref:Uncharacterized protein n=1 Tax=Nocardia camponoti TaxID=1616106 RepID=A0A917VDB9_9NOCA|nr:hypothetical protein GCM10011591_41790 [Nocardia camponoti]
MLAPLVLLIEAVLLVFNVIDLNDAVLLELAMEFVFALVALVMATAARVQYRKLRRSGMARGDAFFAALTVVLPSPVVAVLRHEIGVLGALWRWARRRPDVRPGGTAVQYGQEVRTFVAVSIFLSALEIAVAELLIPWQWLRIVLCVIGIYGAVWLLGFLAATRTRPHVVGPDHLTLRFAYLARIDVPLAAVTRAHTVTHGQYTKTVHIDDGVAALAVMGTTTVAVRLSGPTTVRVNGEDVAAIREVRCTCDEAAALIALLPRRTG